MRLGHLERSLTHVFPVRYSSYEVIKRTTGANVDEMTHLMLKMKLFGWDSFLL